MAKCKECEERRARLRELVIQGKIREASKEAVEGLAIMTGLKKKPAAKSAESTAEPAYELVEVEKPSRARKDRDAE